MSHGLFHNMLTRYGFHEVSNRYYPSPTRMCIKEDICVIRYNDMYDCGILGKDVDGNFYIKSTLISTRKKIRENTLAIDIDTMKTLLKKSKNYFDLARRVNNYLVTVALETL